MNWGYVTGFFDGEGSVYLMKRRYQKRAIRIDISQKDIRPLLAIATFLKCKNINSTIREHGKPTEMKKLSIIRQKDAFNFLKKIKDIAIVKKEKIAEVINYVENYIPKYRTLTHKQENQIKRLWSFGWSYKEIVKKVGLRSIRQVDYITRKSNL